ncbi:MAG: hypothetical protein V3U02_06620 [Calditrichia bacterium]
MQSLEFEDYTMFSKKKITIAITLLTSFVMLIKGIPFGNPVPIADIWIWLLRGVFLVAFAALFSEPILVFYKGLKKIWKG